MENIQRQNEIDLLIKDFERGNLNLNERVLNNFDLPDRNGAGDSTELGYFKGFEYLASVFRGLFISLKQLPDKRELINREDIGYCYPNKKFLSEYIKERINAPSLDDEILEKKIYKYVNHSKDSIDGWIEEIIEEITSQDNKLVHCHFITGKVGSGKTSFIKFIKLEYKQNIQDNNILFIDIKKEDFPIDPACRNYRNKINEDFLRKLLRTSKFKAILNDKASMELFEKQEAKRIFLDALSHISSLGDLEQLYLKLIKKSNMLMENGATYLNFTQEVESALIFTMITLGKKFLVCIDGLDKYSIHDLEHKQFRHLFRLLASKVLHINNVEEKTFFILTLRDCTYDYFVYPFVRDHTLSPSRRKIATADPFNLVTRGLKYYIHKQIESEKSFFSSNEEKIITIFEKFFIFIIKSLDLSSNQLLGLFNYNCRDMLEFLSEAFKLIMHRVATISPEKPSNTQELYNFLFKNDVLDRYIKSYRIFQLYIVRFNDGMKTHCWVSVEYNPSNPSETSKRVKMNLNDKNRGYFDNLYDYNLSLVSQNKIEKENLPLILVKIRILQYLSNNRYEDSKAILKMLNSRGFLVSNKELFTTLEILIHSGLIKTSIKPNKGICFHTTMKGEYGVNVLVKKYIYNEHALHTTAMPNVLRKIIKPMWKVNIEEWIVGNIVNMHFFIKYIEALENREEELIKQFGFDEETLIKNWRISDELQKQAYEDMRSILKVPFRKKYIDIAGLCQNVKEKEDVLNRIDAWSKELI